MSSPGTPPVLQEESLKAEIAALEAENARLRAKIGAMSTLIASSQPPSATSPPTPEPQKRSGGGYRFDGAWT